MHGTPEDICPLCKVKPDMRSLRRKNRAATSLISVLKKEIDELSQIQPTKKLTKVSRKAKK